MKNKLMNVSLAALAMVALVQTAANAERYRWHDGVWRTNSVFVKTHPDKRFSPYFKTGHWYGYDNDNHRWNRYRKMERVNNGYWFN